MVQLFGVKWVMLKSVRWGYELIEKYAVLDTKLNMIFLEVSFLLFSRFHKINLIVK